MAGGLALALAVTGLALISHGDEPSPAEPPTGPIVASQIALVEAQEEPLFAADSNEYRYIVIRDSLSARLPELRAAHPEAEILLYKNVGYTVRDPECEFDPLQGSGISLCTAEGEEDWFLHDDSGARLTALDEPDLIAMNIASPGYRAAWRDEVRGRLDDPLADGSDARYDGVWLDDINLAPGHGLDGSFAELTDDDYRKAAAGFARDVGRPLERAGFTVALNLGMRAADPAQEAAARAIAPLASLVSREQFVRAGEGPLFTAEGDDFSSWALELALAEDIQAAGADFFAIVYGAVDETEPEIYGRASFLLAWDGDDGSALAYRPLDGEPTVDPRDLFIGLPVEDRRQVGVAWVRSYEGGVAAVNPDSSQSQAIEFEERLTPGDGACSETLVLEPVSAAILRPC